MSIRESRTLQRDIEATAIPYGEKVPLKAGSPRRSTRRCSIPTSTKHCRSAFAP